MGLADIPQSILDRVASQLEHFLVPIIALSERTPQPNPMLGSGTLVEINGIYAILTAAHVWDATKRGRNLFLSLTSRGRSSFAIPRNHISPRILGDVHEPEWGPDLALLEISQPYVSTIAAHKSFLNLSRQGRRLAEHPPKVEKGFWMVMGAVEEISDIEVRSEEMMVDTAVRCRSFFSRINKTYHRQGFDYMDVSAKVELPGVPSSFGAVSGGGLWQIDLSMKKSTGILSWDGKRHFRGVAFWQSDISDGRRMIRCHGPGSIFTTAWTAWGFQKRKKRTAERRRGTAMEAVR